MNYSKIGVRYAKALMQASVEDNLLENVKNDMLYIDGIVKSVPEFNQILLSPIIKPSEKQNIFKVAFSTSLSALTVKFLDLLITHRRESRLEDIIRNFLDQYRNYKGIITASLVTPVAIDEATKNKIAAFLQSKYNKTIELKPTIDPSILGGFVLQVEDLQYDSSVQTRLRKVRQELMNTQIENE